MSMKYSNNAVSTLARDRRRGNRFVWALHAILMQMTGKKASTHTRPSWDEYFLEIAELVGSRGTCDRGRAGTVVTRDKRILTTGYVGAPVGVKDCDEVGHELHTVINTDGTASRSSMHKDANALTDALARLDAVGVGEK